MEVIIRGKRIEMEKASCLSGVEASILETLSAGVPDTRQVVASLDKLGRFLMEDENFLVSELMELGLSKEEMEIVVKGCDEKEIKIK